MTSLPSLLRTDRSDRIYRRVLTGIALALPSLLLVILGVLFVSSLPALRRFGPSFFWTSTWDPVIEVYGAAPMVFGTLASSLLALLIAVPLALGVAIFLTEFSPRWLRQPVAFLVELLAAIPSVVYGLWGIFVLIPFLRARSEEHTSELQSPCNLVCRLLLEKKKKQTSRPASSSLWSNRPAPFLTALRLPP